MSESPSQSTRRCLLFRPGALQSVSSGTAIGGLVLHVRPEFLMQTMSFLEGQSGVEIEGVSSVGRLAIVLEAPHDDGMMHLLSQLQCLPGVLSVALVAHFTE